MKVPLRQLIFDKVGNVIKVFRNIESAIHSAEVLKAM